MTEHVLISRKLGKHENFFRSRSLADFYRNFATIGAYSRDVTLDIPLLYRALRKIILDYHILICNVFKDESAGHTIIRPIERATFGDLVEFSSTLFSPKNLPVSEDFMRMLCKEKYPLYSETPLFRVIVAGTHDIAVTLEHTLADGIVAPFFHQEFLKNLAYCEDGANNAEYVKMYGPQPTEVSASSPIFVFSQDKQYLRNSLPPPIEESMQDPSLDYGNNDLKHYTRVAPETHPKKWPGRFPSTLDSHIAFKLFNIGPEDLRVILKQCKEHGVTLTAYVVCILALTLQPIFGYGHHTVSLVAVTLRRFLTTQNVHPSYVDILSNKDYKIMGNHAHMGLPEILAPVTDFSWDLVKVVSGHLGQTVANDKLLNTSKAFFEAAHELEENEQLFTSGLGKMKLDTVKLSNLGYVDFPVYKGKEPWTVTDLAFAQDLAPGAAEFMVNMISTARGGLNIVLSYFDQTFEDCDYENFDEFPETFRKNLLLHAGIAS